jgi:TRAP transporter 4TM/12TM fusion protein
LVDGGKKLEYQETRKESILEFLLTQKRGLSHYWLEVMVCVTSLSLSVYHLFVGYAGSMEAHAFRSTHLAFIMVLCFLLRPLGRKQWTDPKNAWFALDMLFVLLTIAIQVYTLWDLDAFTLRGGNPNDWDIIAGTVLIVLLLEATRRTVGWAMVFIVVFFLAQTAFSDYFFWIFYGPPTPWDTMMDFFFLRQDGIYGIPLMVMATYIFLFILFGAILVRSGAGRFFINLALAITGSRVGGPAKASVVSSCLMASVSGSAVANVVTTGSFTIPLMKRIGYQPHFAGAVEACASSGGQIMPPIMGAAAFIIAEFLNIPYLHVALAGLFPALIYFFSIFVMVHFEARKRNLVTISPNELPSFKEEVKRGGHLFLSIVIIIVLLVIGYTPMFASFWAIISILVLSSLRKETRMSPVDILSALEEGARMAVPVSIACASAGLIIGCVFVSGMGLKFANIIVYLARGSLWIALILTMIASLILGMGLTTTAVYITLAALVIPALIQMGVTPIAAHLFAFYFGLVSAITPPVALAAFAAAGIAGSNPMVTGVHSFRLGIAKYILPFVFVYAPGMVFVGNWHQIVLTIVGSFAGIYALTISTEGWLLVEVKWPVRVFTAFCALLFFLPGLNISISGWAFSLPQWVTQLIAWIILTPAVAWHYIRNREVVQEVAS